MENKEKIFRVLSKKHVMDILRFIDEKGSAEFKEICDKFNHLSPYNIRLKTNALIQVNLIKSVKKENGTTGRARGYIISNREAFEKFVKS